MRCFCIFFVFFFFFLQLVTAQPDRDGRADRHWLLGYDSEYHLDYTKVGGMRFTFNDDSTIIKFDSLGINFREAASSVSDSLGRLLFYSNGVYICDSLDQILNPNQMLGNILGGLEYGAREPQGVVLLPWPGRDKQVLALHMLAGYSPAVSDFAGLRLYKTVVEHANSPQVAEINTIINSNLMARGQIAACRHANGRDWWVLVFGYETRRYYRYLLDPYNLHDLGYAEADSVVHSGLGQSVFSPDGSKFAIYNGVNLVYGNYVDIFDFDRCTGILSNQRQIHFVDLTSYSTGCAISANSRYLYVSSCLHVYQYDLQAPDIALSKDTIAVYDGFLSPLNGYSVTFYLAGLAPDGKIYISSPNTVDYMSVIHTPDSAGPACGMAQHGLELPSRNAFTIPNFPHFRLGALDGSGCDTLGLDAWTGKAPPRPMPLAGAPQLSAYPNPATFAVTIGMGRPLPGPGRMEVHDMQGRLMGAWPLQTATLGYGIDVHTWPAGVYVASVYTGREVRAVQFLKVER